jgi:hypothetical protein
MITRRGLFGLLPAIATLAIPTAANLEPSIEPIILEHTCDWNRSRYTASEIAEMEANGRNYWGCGTKFQWHFGVSPYCPKCGYAYETTLEVLRRGTYRVVQGRIPEGTQQ